MPRRKRADMPRVDRFLEELVWGKNAGNITESALTAGFGRGKIVEESRRSASNYGCELLRQPEVKKRYEAQIAEKKALFKHKALRVAEETFAMATARLTDAFDEHGDFKPMKDWPDELQRALVKSEVEVMKFGGGGAVLDDGGVVKEAISGNVLKIGIADKIGAQRLFLQWSGELSDKLDVNHSGAVYVIDPYAEAPSKGSARK